MDPLSWIEDELDSLEQQQLRRFTSTRSGPQDVHQVVLIGQSLLNFASNDYLGFCDSFVRLIDFMVWFIY